MPTLDRHTTWAATYVLLIKLKNGKTVHDTFKWLGVTEKQWNKYQQGKRKRLKVLPEVA